jgi:hypothetical protein
MPSADTLWREALSFGVYVPAQHFWRLQANKRSAQIPSVVQVLEI